MRKLFFFCSIFILLAKVNAQSINPSTATPCTNCTPTGWSMHIASIDVSNTVGYAGLTFFPWTNAPSTVPGGATEFITGISSESVQTTVTGLTSGVNYLVSFYAAELQNIIGGTVVTSFDGVLDINDGAGTTMHTHAFSGGSSAKWDLVSFTFTAVGTSQVLRFAYQTDPGANGNFWAISVAADAVEEICLAGSSTPILSSTSIGNECPSTTADLTTITASNTPTSTSLTFHTASPASNANKVGSPNTVSAGTYYAAFYDAAGDCYSGDGLGTTAVTVTIEVCDEDGDGVLDLDDLDVDNDGILNSEELSGLDPYDDEDGDGIRNWMDVSDDGNGGDGSSTSYIDLDGNGVPDLFDTDSDGVANHLDLDSDNDGILDIIEAGGIDTDGDGRADDDTDTDGDGFANIFDTDDGGTLLALLDTDLDGIKNYLDLDSDQDGIVDLIEAGGTDANGDGRLDNNADSDGDGIANIIDTDNMGTALAVPDSDADGLANYLDVDSDNDGLLDHIEAQTTLAFSTLLNLDIDNDGIDNRYDIDNGGSAIVLSNTDGDGLPDYLDNDTDEDAFPDWHEGFDDDLDGDVLNDLISRASIFEANNGNPLYYINQSDTDGDGKPDWLEDDDSDNVPNFLDPDHGNYQDSDNDGLVDLYDLDNGGLSTNLPDGDIDGEYDFRDADNQISLPITLASFKATRQGEMVLLEWSTSSEINNESFTVERANENMVFIPILEVSGAGNSNTRLDYVRMDENPMKGYNYYRLRQTDYNGEGEVFHIEAVYFEGHDKMKTFPNPTNGENLFAELNGIEEGSYQLDILTLESKLMISRNIYIPSEQEKVRLNVLENQSLPKGTYYLRLKGATSLIRSMFIVK